MKILKLKSENVKRLQAVEIKPDGNMIVIGGKNGAGKSSVLDSIQWALGGEPDAKMPVRKGEESAKIVADLGDLIVTRTITAAGGGSLIVRNADGIKQDSPQSLLDRLVGKLTFDPLEFSRQKPTKQAETLRALIGLDFTDHDTKRQQVFDSRTTVNRDASALKNRMAAMPKYDDAPSAEQSTASVMAAQAEAVATNANNAARRKAAQDAKDKLIASENQLQELQRQADELAKRIEKGRTVIDGLRNTAKSQATDAANLTDSDVSVFRGKLATVEDMNAKVRANKSRSEVVSEYKSKSDEADKLTSEIEEMDRIKRDKINKAHYPIPGLAFDTAGGVVLSGIPFDQCSSAEQLRVSVAIGMALNPKLRILLIRDGSLLDADSMKLLGDMAEKNDAQVWIERVGTDGDVSVIIEDGSIVKQEAK